jgi:hypothetical protein
VRCGSEVADAGRDEGERMTGTDEKEKKGERRTGHWSGGEVV